MSEHTTTVLTPHPSPDKDEDHEYERREAKFMSAAERYYLVMRSVGFANKNGIRRRGSPVKFSIFDIERDFGNPYDVMMGPQPDKRVEREQSKILAKYELLETVGTDEDTQPEMTVCIPVAINSEKIESIRGLLDTISRRQPEFNEPMQVILWANAQTEDSAVNHLALKNYERLKLLAEEFASPNLQIKTALEIIPKAEFSMSKLRQSFMDGFTGLAMEKGYGTDHVVSWLDADAAMLGSDYFGKLYDRTSADEVGFVHPRVDYAADWAQGKNKTTFDQATRAFLANEIILRAVRRDQNERNTRSYEYTEESGLTFTYLTWLVSGGCNTDDPMNESINLIENVKTATHMAPFDFLVDYRDVMLDKKLDLSRAIDEEVDSAHLALSGRRVYDNVKRYGASALPSDRLGGATNNTYVLYSHADKNDDNDIDTDSVKRHLESHAKQIDSYTTRKKISRVIDNLYK